MSRAARLCAVLAAGVLTGGATGGGDWLFAGVFGALGFLLALPAVLMVHTWKPQWIVATAAAYERRKTAATLLGAGVGIALLLVVSVLNGLGAGGIAVVLLCAACAALLIGFAGCARRQGLRLLRLEPDEADDDAQRLKPLVVGWLARSGAFAVPVLWPLLGAYLVATALGASIVAWLESRRGD